jgi:site-specific recombinase XerD
MKKAFREAQITKNASCHSLRHLFAANLPGDGYDIRTVQKLLGSTDVLTTIIYTHVLNKNKFSIQTHLTYEISKLT